jgi:hypothetical protein
MRAPAPWRIAPLLGIVLITAARPTVAQSQPPGDVAERFLTAVAADRWSEAARLLDLDAFREYVDVFLRRAGEAQRERRPVPTADELRRQEPSMPREVAEWHVRQMREADERMGDPTPYEFAGVRTTAELRRLSPEQAAARWLEARDPGYVIRRQLEAMGCPAPNADELPRLQRRLLGVIEEGDSVAYALHREDVELGGPPAGGEFGVMELTLRRGRWLIQPRGDLLPDLSLDLEPGQCPGDGRR